MPATEFIFEGAAASIAEAYHAFEWRGRRYLPPADLKRLYEPEHSKRSITRLLHALKRSLDPNAEPLHALYMGPSGCGKSMDLSWLAHTVNSDNDLSAELHVLHFGIGEVVGTHDVGFAEVALAVVTRLYASLDHPDKLPSTYLEQVVTWLYGEQKVQEIREIDGNVGLGVKLLNLITVGLSGRMIRRKEVSVRLQQRLPDLVELVENVLTQFRNDFGRHPLIIVDDLEKLTPVDRAMELFLNHGGFFGSLPCHLIFTAPNALCLESRYGPEVLKHFGEHRLMLTRPQPEHSDFDMLRRIVFRRIRSDLVDPGVIDAAILGTAGVLSQLVEVMHSALLAADLDGAPRLRSEDVSEAINVLRLRYFNLLKDEDYEVLQNVRDTGLRAAVSRPALLHNLSVVEYPDTPSEFAVHPIVAELLSRWEQKRVTPHGSE